MWEAASAGQRLNIWTGDGLEGEILRLLRAVALVDRLKAHTAEFVPDRWAAPRGRRFSPDQNFSLRKGKAQR